MSPSRARRSVCRVSAISLLLAVTLAAQVTATAAPAPAGAAIQIQIKDFMFAPGAITIRVGDTVTWVNQDDDVHTVVSEDGSFRSGGLDTGQTYSFTFTRPGTYRFSCSLHPMMVGTVTAK